VIGGGSDTSCSLAAWLLQITDVYAVGAGQTNELLVAEALEVAGAVGGAGSPVFARVVLAWGLG